MTRSTRPHGDAPIHAWRTQLGARSTPNATRHQCEMHHTLLRAHLVILWTCFVALNACANLFALSTASASLCSSHVFLSFAHVIRSSIRALADAKPTMTPMRDSSSVSTVALGCLACVYVLSLTSLSFFSPPTRALLQRRADQRSTRSNPMPSGRHKRSRHQGEMPRARTRAVHGPHIGNLAAALQLLSLLRVTTVFCSPFSTGR
jgi:hypothetical protein